MYNKFINFLENKLVPVAERIGNQRHISAIRDGIISTIPLTIVGGFSLLVASPPVDPELIKPTNILFRGLLKWYEWAQVNQTDIMTPFFMTMAIMSIFVAITIAYNLAQSYSDNLDPLSSGIISGVVFLTISAPMIEGSIPSTYLDATGLFTAMIVAIITVEISNFLVSKGFEIKMPKGVPSAISSTFSSLIPMIVNILLFHTINVIIARTTGASIPALLIQIITPIHTIGDSLGGYLLIVLMIHLLWFVGIHGDSIFGGIIVPLFTTNIMANATAKAAGQPMLYTWTEPVSAFLVFMGGTGATLSLVFLMITSKSKQLKTVGKVGLIPGLFGINEPIIFGTPLILNPHLLIPFFLVPVINALIAYFTINTGLIGRSFLSVPWTSPPFIGLPLSTMDINAFFLVVFVFILDALIYYPFFKLYEKSLIEIESSEE